MDDQKKPLTKQEIERIAHEQASPALFASSETPQEINREKQYNKAMQENAPYLTLGAQLAGTMLLGAGIGWWVKSKTGDDMWLGIGAGIGAVFGLAYFILVVLRLEKEKSKKK